MSSNVKTPRTEELLKKAQGLPQKPGCYLMKRGDGGIIYVGKALNLKSRVSSYFNNSSKTLKTELLVSHITDFDFLITESEAEALILENNLIKKYSPKYNIRLKDDKSYPYVMVDLEEPFARLLYVRKPKRGKKTLLYGPFPEGSNISQVLRILRKSFLLRDCSNHEFRTRKEPCLLYQMKQCTAPCVEKVSSAEYQVQLDAALSFFEGKGKKALEVLKAKMFEASDKEEFEQAAMLRDYIATLEAFVGQDIQENVELEGGKKDVDIVAWYQGETELDVSLYMIRNNLLLGHKNFDFLRADFAEEESDELCRYLMQYYTSGEDSLPQSIVLDLPEEKRELLNKALGNIDVRGPGRKYDGLVKLAFEQAKGMQELRLKTEASVYVGLNRLKDLLSLSERPKTLECYDIAIFQGTSPTASQIVFYEGRPEKKAYRHYHLETKPEGNNDFAMMKEVLSRRLKHGNLPDVFIVDGGLGQVNVFLEVLKEEGIDLPVVGIAKARTEKKTEERLVIPGRMNPFILNKCRPLFRIVTQMRDEAHRFSRRLHHKEESERLFSSFLDEIKGINAKRKQEIMSRLEDTWEDLAKLRIEDLQESLDLSEREAKILWTGLSKFRICTSS